MKKITYHEANYIIRRTKPHRLERLICNWYIRLDNPNSGHIICKIKLPAYIILFIPMVLIDFCGCIWDGGIKTFSIQPRTIHNYCITGLTNEDARTKFGRLKSVWEKNNENNYLR